MQCTNESCFEMRLNSNMLLGSQYAENENRGEKRGWAREVKGEGEQWSKKKKKNKEGGKKEERREQEGRVN